MMNPSRHRRNTAFVWRPSQPPYRRVTNAQATQYDEDGYFVFENAFTHAEVDAVAAAIDPIEREIEERLKADFNGRLQIAKAATGLPLLYWDYMLRGHERFPKHNTAFVGPK